MAEMTFAEHRFAMRFREWARKLMQSELAAVWPSDTYGNVIEVDYAAMRATVARADLETGVPYPFARTMQPVVGHTVRVSGRSSNRYISAITSPPIWVPATVEGDWLGVGTGPEYMRDSHGNVRMRGVVGHGTAGTALATLPEHHRPDDSRFYVGAGGLTTFIRVDVDADGSVIPRDTADVVTLDMSLFDANVQI